MNNRSSCFVINGRSLRKGSNQVTRQGQRHCRPTGDIPISLMASVGIRLVSRPLVRLLCYRFSFASGFSFLCIQASYSTRFRHQAIRCLPRAYLAECQVLIFSDMLANCIVTLLLLHEPHVKSLRPSVAEFLDTVAEHFRLRCNPAEHIRIP